MKRTKIRRQIAWQAARLMYDREESEYFRAKMKAARKICQGWVKPSNLPSNAEIRDEIQQLARQFEGDTRTENLLEMRVAALRLMQLLERYRPKLIGSVLTGHVRQGSDIDLHVFTDNIHAITGELDYNGIRFEVVRKKIRKDGIEQTFQHVHVFDRYEFELTVYSLKQHSFVFKSSITGKAIERASIAQLEQMLAEQYDDVDVQNALQSVDEKVDRFQVYYALLLPLENVKQSLVYHPEGDALYHSLQVYDLACDRRPYDEEFLLAALLHDVGKGIDANDHVSAAIEALDGLITERTVWLIENHMLAHKIRDLSIGARKHRRLREHESYHELVELGECDRAGRVAGVPTTELEDVLDYIREISQTYG